MSISDRYRSVVADVREFCSRLQAGVVEPGQDLRSVQQALQGLAELEEQVGEIPRFRLETDLTPVLLKAHSQLDRARLLLEEAGAEDQGAAVWELEQKLYRLLNDL